MVLCFVIFARMIKKIEHKGNVIAIIISHRFAKEGIEFFTPNDYSQQLGYMNHKAGKKIDAHVHNEVKREVTSTQEVLFIKKGKIRVDFYTKKTNYIKSDILVTGDIILLASGGHGFEIIEDTEMYEVKQGPFSIETDKKRFDAVNPNELKIG